MKSKKNKSLVFLVFIVFIFNSCFKDDLLKEIDALKTQVSTMQRRNDSLNNVLNVRADSLGKALSDTQKRSDSLANVLRTKSDSLSLALGITNTNLANLTKSVDSIKSQIANISGQLTQLNLQLTSITTQLTQLNQQLGALGGDVSQLAAQYQALSTSLQTINNQIAALQAEQLKLLEKLNAILLQLNPSVDIKTGLIGYYPFSGNAGDSSGNGNHGIATGISLSTDRFGVPNRSYFFNGVNSYPLPPDPVQQVLIQNKFISLSSDYSISAWFSSSDVNKFQQCIINSTPHTGFAVELNNENVRNRLMYGVGPGNAFWTRIYLPGTTTNFQNNLWYHMTFVKSGSNYTLYLNGQIESTIAIPQSSSYTESAGLVIGSIGDGNEVFKGKIDEVRVYNRALTQDQITYLATH